MGASKEEGETVGCQRILPYWCGKHDGDEVEVCIMSTEAKARDFRPSDAELEVDTDAAVS